MWFLFLEEDLKDACGDDLLRVFSAEDECFDMT